MNLSSSPSPKTVTATSTTLISPSESEKKKKKKKNIGYEENEREIDSCLSNLDEIKIKIKRSNIFVMIITVSLYQRDIYYINVQYVIHQNYSTVLLLYHSFCTRNNDDHGDNDDIAFN
jgi:hypothetical protein